MKSCDECKLFINIGKTVILKDSSEHQKILCRECYLKMTKVQKKEYSFVEGNLDVRNTISGFMMQGILGAISTSSRPNPDENDSIKESQKKYAYTQREMDDFSIDFFDRHSGLLNESRHRAVVDKFEGKINSRHYRKHIENYVQP